MMKNAELYPLYGFDCDECGRENFVRLGTTEVDDNLRNELISQAQDACGDDALIRPEVMTVPREVTCKHCGTTYKSKLQCETDDQIDL